MWWIVTIALAYEVDPWTPRTQSVADGVDHANTAFDRLLDDALSKVRCSNSDRVLRRRVARQIQHATARRMLVNERPGLGKFGYGAFSGWLERDPSIDRVYTGTKGIYSQVKVGDSAVLRLAGTASTVRFGDVLLGTDKVDHFLATGHAYFRWSRQGKKPQRAIRRGVRSERQMLGSWTSKAFSYADLAANWDGYGFYRTLLEPGSVIQREEHVCVVRTEDWDWRLWVHPDWDEFVNTSVYRPKVVRAIELEAEPDRAKICAEYSPSEPRVPLEGMEGKLPHQEGPLGLPDFCRGLETDPAEPEQD